MNATRTGKDFSLGASPRASLALFRMAQALALYRGRDYATPYDVKYLVPFVLCHRLLLTREAKLSGLKTEAVLNRILSESPAPSLRK